MSTLRLKIGDCVDRMAELPEGSVGAIVSDPPYGLRFMGKEFDDLGDGGAQREWHRGWINQAYRVLKPGGVIKAFGGTRTFHHFGAVMRDVGFTDIRVEAWSYGSGFPKSLSIGKAIDKAAGAARDVQSNITAPATDAARTWEGWGTALKPSWEPVIVGRKPY